jgi:lysophospholipase L1-like esterase
MSKKFFVNIILLLSSLLFSIVIAEVFCRYYYFGNVSFQKVSIEDDFWNYHDKLGWFHPANFEGQFSNPREGFNGYVKFDEHGIRVNDNGLTETEQDLPKILVVGDSMTAGLEVDNNETYVAVLEKLLWENSCQYQTYNAGTRGYGTDQSLLIMEEFVPQIKPDYVVYMFCYNDFGDNRVIKGLYRKYSKPAYVFNDQQLTLINNPPKKYPREYFANVVPYSEQLEEGYGNAYTKTIGIFMRDNLALYHPIRIAFNKYNAIRYKDSKNYLEYDAELIKNLLLKMRMINPKLILVSYSSEYDKLLANIAKKLDIKYINIHKSLQDNPSSYHWKTDGHWNEKGHSKVANALFNSLKPQLCHSE